MVREFSVFRNYFCLPTLSENFSAKNACFFAAIKFSTTYFAFYFNSFLIGLKRWNISNDCHYSLKEV